MQIEQLSIYWKRARVKYFGLANFGFILKWVNAHTHTSIRFSINFWNVTFAAHWSLIIYISNFRIISPICLLVALFLIFPSVPPIIYNRSNTWCPTDTVRIWQFTFHTKNNLCGGIRINIVFYWHFCIDLMLLWVVKFCR